MGWIIFFDILLIIAIALFLSVSVSFKYDGEFFMKITYAGIKIFSLTPEKAEKKTEEEAKEQDKPEKDVSPKKAEEKQLEKQSEKAAESTEKVAEAASDTAKKVDNKKKSVAMPDGLSEKIELIKTMAESAGAPAKRLFRHIRIVDVYADLVAGGEDAQQAALNYGKLNWAVSGVFATLDALITLKIKKLNITVNFNKEEPDYFLSGKIKLRLSTALGCGIWFFFNIIKNTIKKNMTMTKNGGHKYGRASNSGVNGNSNGENSRAG